MSCSFFHLRVEDIEDADGAKEKGCEAGGEMGMKEWKEEMERATK